MIVYYLYKDNPVPQKQETNLNFSELLQSLPEGCQFIIDEPQFYNNVKRFVLGNAEGLGNWEDTPAVVYYLYQNNPEPQKVETTQPIDELLTEMPEGCQGIIDEHQFNSKVKEYVSGPEEGCGNWNDAYDIMYYLFKNDPRPEGHSVSKLADLTIDRPEDCQGIITHLELMQGYKVYTGPLLRDEKGDPIRNNLTGALKYIEGEPGDWIYWWEAPEFKDQWT